MAASLLRPFTASVCNLCRHEVVSTSILYFARLGDLTTGAGSDVDRIVFCLPPSKPLVLDPECGFWKRLTSHDDAHSDVSVPERWLLPSRDARSGCPVFALCNNCFIVTRYYVLWRSRTPSWTRPAHSICSLEDLYEGLSERFTLDSQEALETQKRWLQWRHLGDSGPFERRDGNPVRPIPSLPRYILQLLERAPPEAACDACFDPVQSASAEESPTSHDTGLLGLPLEILCEIASLLDASSVFALRLSCTLLARRLPLDQMFWYRQFLAGNLFGFLLSFETFDILEEIYKRSRRQHKVPPHWDWRKLVRQLAQLPSFEMGGDLEDAPADFKLCRSIWKVFEAVELERSQNLLK